MHAKNRIVAVWVDLDCFTYSEDFSFYSKAYELGVDMLTTDYPIEA